MSDELANIPKPDKRRLLLCVAGGTPQIITETLWALHHRKDRVDEIRVITTLNGAEKILTGKINGRGTPDESLLDPTEGQFFRFLRDFPAAGPIKFDANCLYLLTNKRTGVPSPRDDRNERLPDIVTDEDNERAANQICNIVFELASERSIHIHASIAGGRKTMSLYLMAAMQLFGRSDDTMSHVLVSKEVEFGAPKFFYKPPTAENVLDPTGKPKVRKDGTVITTDDVDIHLATIPFIRLGGIGSEVLKRRFESYDSLVVSAQRNLERYNLTFQLATAQVNIGEQELKLGLSDFFVYFMFAYLRKKNRGRNGFLRVDEISLNDFDAVCREISKAMGNELGYREFYLLRQDALESLNYQFFKERHPKITDSLAHVKKTLGESVSAIRGALRKAGVSEDFAVINENKFKKKLEPCYGLKLDVDRVKVL